MEQVTECRNCGAILKGEFCHVCGQSAEEPRRAVIGLVQDVVVDTLAIDGKLFRTLFLLLTRPGRLARRYLDGKRVRYSPPFRLFLFTSVFFYFFAFSTIDFDQRDALTEIEETVATELAAEIEAETGKPWNELEYDGPAWIESYVKQLYEAAQRAREDPRLFMAQIRENVPRTMFLAPLIYALILMVLYVYRRKYLVYDHLVASLYMHAALYAYMLILLTVTRMPAGPLLAAPVVIWGLLQPYAVFRQLYGSNWLSVILKGFISTTLYAAAFTLLLSLGVSFALYQA